MRILSCELVKYKRMMLNRIDSFIIKPNQIIQLILGTNGSGKSSLLKELTPLPADANDYAKDGSKTITVSHNGSTYVLKSVFSPKTEHSFEKNGVELNRGGTVTVQRELVKQEFGVTQEIHDLITGLETFHSMSPSRRREWFTQLSDVSFDYALAVFGRLKERSRDLTGALRTAKKRLVTEAAKVISSAEEEKLRHDVDLTLKELQLLIEQSAPVDRPVVEYERDINAGMEDLTRMSNRLLRMQMVAPYGVHPYGADPRKGEERDDWGERVRPGFTSVEEIESLIDQLKHEITAKEALINNAVVEHGKIEETVKILIKTGEDGVRALHERVEKARLARNTTLAQRKLGIEGIDPVNASSALETLREALTAILVAIPANNGQFSTARLKEVQDLLLVKKDDRLKASAELMRLASRKSHLEAHKALGSTTCPKCNHVWIAGYSDQNLTEVEEAIATKENDLKAIDAAIVEVEKEITAIQEYSDLYREYMRQVRNWPILNPLWDYLTEQRYVITSPLKALSVIETFRTDLTYDLAAHELDNQIQETLGLIAAAAQVGDANLTEQRVKLEEVAHVIDRMTGELTTLQKTVGEYSYYRRQLTEALELQYKIKAMLISVEQHNVNMVEMIRRETIAHCIRQLQHALAIKQETLQSVIIQKSLVADLEHQITKLTVDEEAAKILVNELSPTDGLIAEGLFGFIRTFTGQMNNIIRKIWSYPLQVLDCGIAGSAGAELDYKFPMMVQTKDNIVSDVKFGSTGMREIVNLAFKIVGMWYLGLSEHPLFLDEFAASFDEAHRVAATNAIKNLMEQQPFTQLWMVSHYESSYGAFTNADICVLCDTNITIPDSMKYNQHVKIN